MLSTQRYMQCVYAYICVHAHEHEHVHMSMCMCYILPHATCSRLTASAPPRVSVCRLLCHGPHHAALRLASPSMKHATMYGDNGSGGHKPGDSQLGAARSAPRRTSAKATDHESIRPRRRMGGSPCAALSHGVYANTHKRKAPSPVRACGHAS